MRPQRSAHLSAFCAGTTLIPATAALGQDVEALITAEPSVQDAAAADESEDEQQDQNLDSNTFVDQVGLGLPPPHLHRD